ncbi:MAG: NADPH-dependent FMN reductase [Pseudomonadota bacterium]
MKWVVWVGSVRKGSYNAALARALQGLAPEGVTIELLPSVADLPVYSGDIESAGLPEAVVALGEEIAQADGIVVVSPEYNYSVPGGLKNAIDWVSRLKPMPLKGKPLLIQSASMGNLGGARMQYHLRQILVGLDVRVMNVPEVMVGAAHKKVGEDGVLADEGTRDFLRTQLQAFAAFAAKG